MAAFLSAGQRRRTAMPQARRIRKKSVDQHRSVPDVRYAQDEKTSAVPNTTREMHRRSPLIFGCSNGARSAIGVTLADLSLPLAALVVSVPLFSVLLCPRSLFHSQDRLRARPPFYNPIDQDGYPARVSFSICGGEGRALSRFASRKLATNSV